MLLAIPSRRSSWDCSLQMLCQHWYLLISAASHQHTIFSLLLVFPIIEKISWKICTTSVPFHLSTWMFLRVLIWCLFSHFSVQSSILCTSWRGRRILFRSFFAVFKCLIHRYKHNNRIPLFLLEYEPACVQYLRAVSDTHKTWELRPLRYPIQKMFLIANFKLTKVRWSTGHHVTAPVSSLLEMPWGTTAPAGAWSSGSMRVRYVRKTGGCPVFCFKV